MSQYQPFSGNVRNSIISVVCPTKRGRLLIILVLLLSLVGTFAASVQADTTPITFTGAELLGRPTDTSISVSIVPDAAISLYYEYGTTPGVYTGQTATVSAPAGQPTVVVISGLTANAEYYYRMQYSTDGGTTWVARPVNSFRTQRAAGSTFTFDITSDSHIDILLGNPTTWTNTLNDVADDDPDFHIDLGDTAAMDDGSTSVAVGDTAAAEQVYKDTLPYFNIVSGSSPIYLVAGNHEQQEAWHLLAPLAGSLPVMGKNAEKKFYLNPVPDGSFYTGNTGIYSYLSGDQLKQDYYAWTWGDALFVMISPYWTTTTKPYTTLVGGGETDTTGSGDRWDWTLGLDQFNWLKTILQNSTAKYKFVFAHQIVGGNSLSSPDQVNYGHGGVDSANLVEWGGYNVGGTVWGWDTERPGWGSQPIHQMMVANGVSAFFHGHDHQYAYELLDGIVYQAVPSGSFTGNFGIYTTGGNDGKTIQALTSTGHLRVNVGPSQATVEYIRTGQTSSAYTYTIAPAAVMHNLTMAVDPVGGGTTDPSVGVHSYTEGSVVGVTAMPNSGYVFDHWSGACIGDGACSVTMDAAKSVTAHFVAGTAYNLTIAADPAGGGTTEPAVGVHSYAPGSVVSVTATPAAGYVFAGWGGACSGTGCCTVTMNADKTVTANFTVAVSHIADIGSNTIKDSANTNLAVTTNAAVDAGRDIVVAYATDPNQDLTITVSDAAGNKYQQAAMGISAGSLRTYIFVAYDAIALPSGSAITINQNVVCTTAVAARAAVVGVFDGLAPVGALEQTGAGSQTGGATPSSGAATTVQPVQLLIGVVGTEGPGGDAAGTWQNSFTAGLRAGTTGGTADTNITVSLGWQIVTAAGDYTAAKTGITSRDSATAIATFKTTDAGLSFIGDIGRAQSKTAGTSLAVTTNAAVAAGDDILVTFATDPAGAVSSVTDSAGNTYSQVVDVTNSGNVRTIVYAAYNVTALPSGSTITIVHASVTARSAAVTVFRGLTSSAVVDQTKTATGNTAAVSSGAAGTTTQADELLIGAVGLEGPNYDAPSIWQNSFTFGPRLGTTFGTCTGGGDTDITAQMGWRIVGATGAYQAQLVNQNTTRDWAAAIATFKADYRLTVAIDPAGSATTVPAVGAHNYALGSVVGVTVTPAAGYVFDHWSGACTGSGTCSVTVDAAKTVTAHFAVSVDVTVARSGVDDVELTWQHLADVVDHYAVYRSLTEPYFSPGAAYWLDDVATSEEAYLDEDADLSTAGGTYFYLVGPVNECGGACGSSNRTGAFVYGLLPGQ